MNQDLIADIWNIISDNIPDSKKGDIAQEYLNTLIDYGVSESVLEGLFGIDTYLDQALEYIIDDDEIEEDEEDHDEWN